MHRHAVFKKLVAMAVGALLMAGPASAGAQERAASVREAAPPGAGPYASQFTIAVTGGNADCATTRLVKLYHDGNSASGPSARCGRHQNSFSPMSCTIAISGYLVDK